MQFNTFKLSAIALAVASLPTVANAAVYTVERVDNASASESAKATAISPNGEVAYEVLSGPEGINYSEEVPFFVDNEHYINNYDSFVNYCGSFLGYDTCGDWGREQWYGVQITGEICDETDYDSNLCAGGKKSEVDAWTKGYESNSRAYTIIKDRINPFGSKSFTNPPSGTQKSDSTNVIIHSVDDSGNAVGSSSGPYFQSAQNARVFALRGFNNTTELLPPSNSTSVISQIGQTNANGSIDLGSGRILTFGSASVQNMAEVNNESKDPEGSGLINLGSCANSVDYSDRACQYFQFANQASVWVSNYVNNTNSARVISSFPNPNGAARNAETAQASVRGAALVNASTSPTLVGYSTYLHRDAFYTSAVKYTPIGDDATFSSCLDNLNLNEDKGTECWSTDLIPDINIDSGDGIIYDYTVANDINSKGVTVGVAKSNNPINGSYSEQVFINDSAGTTLLNATKSNLFFRGYNASAAAINKENELVGKVDVETVQDRSRRQRGYIYLHDGAQYLASTFDNTRGWLLDDLTNDGNANGEANKYRIAEAFDINDRGDIAASAFYCPNGYSSTAQNALCNGTEQLVAVKLTRDNNGDITPRSEINEPVQRSGASFGLAGLGLLVLGGLWRRKK